MVSVKREPFPGPTSLARLAGRLALVAFALLAGIGFATRLGHDPAAASLGALTSVAGGVPLFGFRLRPALVFTALATAGIVILGNGDSHAIVWFGLVVVAGWCVLSGGVRVGIVNWAGTALVFGGEWLWARRDPGWAPWAAGVTVSVLATVLIRHQLGLVERLRAAQADLAARTRLDERSRIARELHDVLAHSLTVALLHVTSARLAVEHDPADAARALAEAERLGRQALTEVRATMGPLRDDEKPSGLAPPVPGFGGVPVLVEELRQVGVEVDLVAHGEPDNLPETVGTTIYRIVQEALTNAAKHAPTAKVVVSIELTDRDVDVRVESAGPAGHGSGMGLINMAERADAIGGTCSAGPGGLGWLVRATLPHRAHRTAAG